MNIRQVVHAVVTTRDAAPLFTSIKSNIFRQIESLPILRLRVVLLCFLLLDFFALLSTEFLVLFLVIFSLKRFLVIFLPCYLLIFACLSFSLGSLLFLVF